MNYRENIEAIIERIKPLKVKENILRVVREQQKKPVTLEQARAQVKRIVRCA